MHNFTFSTIRVLQIFIVLFLITSFSKKSSAQGNAATTGSGYCLDFTPNLTNNNYVDLGQISAIDTGNFTIEMWLNVRACENDPAFFSNKDWSSGSNPGIAFDIHDKGTKLRVNLKASNSSFQNITIPINAIGRGWFHLAVTLNRDNVLTIYIDGIEQGRLNVESALKGSFTSPYTYKLGQDGTGAYSDDKGMGIRYDGKIDEVRIWKVARTEQEIRENMCKKLDLHTPNLYTYFNCDTLSGDIVPDLTGTSPGKWVKGVAESWKVSGAPIGDISTMFYSELEDWNGVTLRLADTLFGAFNVKNVLALKGLHVYKVNSSPSYLNELPAYPDNANYYGVFLVATTNSTTYDANFEYANYTTAIADAANLKLFTRNQNSDPTWSESIALHDFDKHILTKQSITLKKEFILGTKAAASCNAPSAPTLISQANSYCIIGWTPGSASKFNTQWGLAGFELGTGTSTLNSDVNPQTINGISTGSNYEFYVQDQCNATSASYWVGPYLFYPGSCLLPTNYIVTSITTKSAVLSWNGNGRKSDVEWGLLGFTLGQGIPDSTLTDSLKLVGLAPNTSYAYYVKTDCPIGNNEYKGPFTFKTLKLAAVKENELFQTLNIYPNPTHVEFEISLFTLAKKISISIYNVLGEEILMDTAFTKDGKLKQAYSVVAFPKGLYFIRITDGVNSATKPIVIQ